MAATTVPLTQVLREHEIAPLASHSSPSRYTEVRFSHKDDTSTVYALDQADGTNPSFITLYQTLRGQPVVTYTHPDPEIGVLVLGYPYPGIFRVQSGHMDRGNAVTQPLRNISPEKIAEARQAMDDAAYTLRASSRLRRDDYSLAAGEIEKGLVEMYGFPAPSLRVTDVTHTEAEIRFGITSDPTRRTGEYILLRDGRIDRTTGEFRTLLTIESHLGRLHEFMYPDGRLDTEFRGEIPQQQRALFGLLIAAIGNYTSANTEAEPFIQDLYEEVRATLQRYDASGKRRQ